MTTTVQVARSGLAGGVVRGLLLALMAFPAAQPDEAAPDLDLGRDRFCCRYSGGSSPCWGPDACLTITAGEEAAAGALPAEDHPSAVRELLGSPPGDECRVAFDSKMGENGAGSGAPCLDPGQLPAFGSGGRFDLGDRLPFLVKPYLMGGNGLASRLPAVDLRIRYDLPWSRVDFRLANADLCAASNGGGAEDGDGGDDGRPQGCNPRCVEIVREKTLPDEVRRDGAPWFLTYDCEVGFFVSRTAMTATTSENTYELSLCLSTGSSGNSSDSSGGGSGFSRRCGSYLFRMPDPGQARLGAPLVLVDKEALLKDGKIVVHFPENHPVPTKVALGKLKGDGSVAEVLETLFSFGNVSSSGILELPLEAFDSDGRRSGPAIDSGLYTVLLDDQARLATFQVVRGAKDEYGSSQAMAVLLALALVFLSVLTVAAYYQYARVKRLNIVDPHRLLDSGRIHARKILIVSNVDNRHHVDIVFQLNKYLKAHCGVGEIYFAPDPDTGISSQVDHDPWTWAQNTANLISEGEGGHLVFVGAPPEKMGITIYKDLPNKQAFISTGMLKELDEKNRVSVLMFPYSDPTTIPAMLPNHVAEGQILLPQGMNRFLCKLLEVRNRELCSCLPIPFIQPEVCPRDFTAFSGGQELLAMVQELTEKVESFRKQQRAEELAAGGENSVKRDEDESAAMLLEDRARSSLEMASARLGYPTGQKKTSSNQQQEGLKVEIEAGIKSLDSAEMRSRDPDDIELV